MRLLLLLAALSRLQHLPRAVLDVYTTRTRLLPHCKNTFPLSPLPQRFVPSSRPERSPRFLTPPTSHRAPHCEAESAKCSPERLFGAVRE